MLVKNVKAIDESPVLLYHCISTETQLMEVVAMYRDFDRNAPMFLQIFDRLKKDIISAKYPPNSQIPTVRQLAFDMSVNPNTVQRALQLLEDEGLIITRATLGKFVTSDIARISAVKKEIQRETLRAWIREMQEIGISTESIVEFINNDGGRV